MMPEDIPDPKAQREARDIAFMRTFHNAFEVAEQLSDVVHMHDLVDREARTVTVPFDLLQRAAMMMSFCAGYAAGAAHSERDAR
jgi:hypothetical protein